MCLGVWETLAISFCIYQITEKYVNGSLLKEKENLVIPLHANYDLIDEIELKLQKSKSTSDQQTERQTDKQMRTTQN